MATELDRRGFVKVSCGTCHKPDVWLRCQKCAKADHFEFDGRIVGCDCGATYDHATCTCGATNPPSALAFVPFEKGPVALADLEWDPARVGIVAVVLAAAALVTAYGAWTLLS
jgi:hypothetical protein